MFSEKRAKTTWSWLRAQCLTRALEKSYLLSDEEELPGLGIRKLSLYALFHVSFWKRSAHADNTAGETQQWWCLVATRAY